MTNRTAPNRVGEVVRETKETRIRVRIDLDGTGKTEISTGVGFYDHMLESFGRHGGFDLQVETKGDLHIDMHHTVEDTGIVLGQAFKQACDEFKGIRRFGTSYIPMDETLTRCAVDLSNRPYLIWKVDFTRPKVGEMDTELFKEFHQAFAMNAGACVHLETLYGDNTHHIAESGFKGVRRFGHAYIPMDETLTRCAIDLSNRPYLIWNVSYKTPKVGDMDTELFKEFHHAFAMNCGACVHLETLYGTNSHHIAESGFKALARALRTAVELDPKTHGHAPSTKGVL